jgi:NAD(P)-dependent dehydrogenase (short-subunit alcohol dehydrogenase family)
MSSGAREGTPWTAHHVGGAAYSAAKAGIHGFIRDAAMELAEYGIRINSVAPGPIETERTAQMFEELRETSDHSPHRPIFDSWVFWARSKSLKSLAVACVFDKCVVPRQDDVLY